MHVHVCVCIACAYRCLPIHSVIFPPLGPVCAAFIYFYVPGLGRGPSFGPRLFIFVSLSSVILCYRRLIYSPHGVVCDFAHRELIALRNAHYGIHHVASHCGPARRTKPSDI